MASHPTKFVLCLKNKGYEASLELLKIYRLLTDRGAEKHKLVRVVDESGDDYLFPASYFKPIELPAPIRRAYGLPSNNALERTVRHGGPRLAAARSSWSAAELGR
jgi:hypothetical protein